MVEILSIKQIELLKLIGQNQTFKKQFYLTGGTPLAAFYLNHRYSEDLDFFSFNEVTSEAIHIFFGSLQHKLQIVNIDFQQTYNRNLFFLKYEDGEILKTEFTYFPFTRIETGTEHFEVSCDSLLDIMVNKVFTIYSRSKARDYIDLYYGIKQFGFKLNDLIKLAKQKFDWHIDPLQLGTQFMKSMSATDYPRMIKNIDNNEWQDFFIEAAKQLKNKIIDE